MDSSVVSPWWRSAKGQTHLFFPFCFVGQLQERISELEQERDLLRENNEKLVNRWEASAQISCIKAFWWSQVHGLVSSNEKRWSCDCASLHRKMHLVGAAWFQMYHLQNCQVTDIWNDSAVTLNAFKASRMMLTCQCHFSISLIIITIIIIK